MAAGGVIGVAAGGIVVSAGGWQAAFVVLAILSALTLFDDLGAPARAMARLSAARGMRSATYRERTAAFRDRFADVFDPLPDDQADRRFALIRYLVSSTTWLTLREEFELDGPEAAEAIAWALETLLDDLREHGDERR